MKLTIFCVILGNNILYLSHDLPDMQELESIYVFIWQWINQPTPNAASLEKVLDKQNIKIAVLNEIWGLMTKEQLSELCHEIDNRTVIKIWQSLLDNNFIDEDSKIIVDASSLSADEMTKIFPNTLNRDVLNRICFFLYEKKTRQKMINIPKYFEKFVLLHLDRWIESSIRALLMEDQRQYIIEADVGKTLRSPNPSPLILDLDTGADQLNSQWDEALHQFLQLKHGCSLSLQSLKSVFISNVTYLKLYENLFGMSGTLGSQQEQESLTRLHNVDFIIIPTHKPKRFIEMEPIISKNLDSWCEKICDQCKTMARTRAVLIICETIKDVLKFYNQLINEKSMKVVTLCREVDALKFGDTKIEIGHVIIATNLAGRGMDLKLCDKLKAAGGLHVQVTFLPTNIRIEQQAFGRAARAGDTGSGQLLINSNCSNSTILEMKQERNNNEIVRLETVYNYYTKFVEIEESFFEQFSQQYRNIAETHEEIRIFKQSFLYNWSFWLDEHSQLIGSDCKETTGKLLESMKNFMDGNRYEKDMDWSNLNIHKTAKVNYVLYCNETRKRSIKEKAFQKISTATGNETDPVHVDIMNNAIFSDPEHSLPEAYYKFYFSKKFKNNSPRSLSIEQIDAMTNINKMLEARKDQRLLRIEILKPTVHKNKRSIIQVRGLQEQQANYDQLDNILITSITKILGPSIYPETFEEIFFQKQSLCQDLVDTLVEVGVLESAKVTKNISMEKCGEVSMKNFIPKDSFYSFLEIFKDSEINMRYFGDVIKENIPLPSRENFWNILKHGNVIHNEVEYVDFNKFLLDDVDPSLLQYLESDEMKLKLVQLIEEKNEIFLYKIDSSGKEEEVSLFFELASLQNICDSKKVEALRSRNCLAINKKAKFDSDKAKNFIFESFSTLTAEDFELVKIGKAAAEQILELLVQTEVLAVTYGKGYKLNKGYESLYEIDLKENGCYASALLNLMNHCFCYQIAFEKLRANMMSTDDAQEKVIHLPTNTHLTVSSDLFTYGLIDSIKVNPNKSGDMEKEVDKVFTNEFSFDQLESIINSSMTEITDIDSMEQFTDILIQKGIIREIYSMKQFTDNFLRAEIVHHAINLDGFEFAKKFEICDFDVKTCLGKQYKKIGSTIILNLQNQKLLFSKKKEISQKLEDFVPSLQKKSIECPEIILKPLEDEAPHLKYADEFQTYINSGIPLVMRVEEKKFTKAVTIRFFFIMAIAIAQILMGALISTLSLGLLTFVGKAMISEGIGDIIFASTSFYSGHFTWSDYRKHKKISVAITVLTFGIGAYMTDLKNTTGFGYKHFGDKASKAGKAFAEMTGRELFKEVGLKEISKEVFKSSFKSIASAVTIASVSITVDNFLINRLHNAIHALTSLSNVGFKKKLNHPDKLELLKDLFNIMGKEKLKEVIQVSAKNHIKEMKRSRDAHYQAIDIIDNIIKSMDSNKSPTVNWMKNLLIAVSSIDKISTYKRLANIADRIIADVMNDLKSTLNSTKSTTKYIESKIKWEDIQSEIVECLSVPIDAELSDVVKQRIVAPLLKMLGNKVVVSTAGYIKQAIDYGFEQRDMRNYKHSSKILKSLKGKKLDKTQLKIKERHERRLTNLMRKTTNPKLVAALIRENIQINMIGVEAASKVIPDILKAMGHGGKKCQIKVEQSNGDVHTYGEPGGIEINLKLKDNHFINEAVETKGNDCLLHALADQVPQLKNMNASSFRELLAQRIEHDPQIQHVIRMGWHINTMERGAVGGREPAGGKYESIPGKINNIGEYSMNTL